MGKNTLNMSRSGNTFADQVFRRNFTVPVGVKENAGCPFLHHFPIQENSGNLHPENLFHIVVIHILRENDTPIHHSAEYVVDGGFASVGHKNVHLIAMAFACPEHTVCQGCKVGSLNGCDEKSNGVGGFGFEISSVEIGDILESAGNFKNVLLRLRFQYIHAV